MIALMANPDQYELLKKERTLLPNAVEEMLRWWTPVMHFRRTATRDIELSGTPIGDGTRSWSGSPPPTGTSGSSQTPTGST